MSIVVILFFFVISFAFATASVIGVKFVLDRTAKDIPVSRVRHDPEDEVSVLLNEAIFKRDELSSISVWNWLLTRLDFMAIVRRTLDQADIDWTVGRMTMAMLFCATLTMSLTWDTRFVPMWLSLILTPLSSFIPYIWVLHKRTQRFRKFRDGFPDALDTFSRALRAGSPVAGALQAVGEETPEPISSEIKKTLAENTLGMPLDKALDNLASRVPSMEVSLFVTALQIHGRTGGKLGDVMGRLSESVRESVSLEGEVRAIAAHGKLTGMILTILPLGIAAMMMMVSPGYLKNLIDHPIGKDLIAAAVGCLVAAHFVIRKLIQIEV